MTQQEKEALLSLLCTPARWCQGMEASDAAGESVPYDDAGAVAWDLTGGLCFLFGWERATELFPELEPHITGRTPGPGDEKAAIPSMTALQDFNDRPGTTHDALLARIQTLPVLGGLAPGIASPAGRGPTVKELNNVQSN
ncbi:MAG: hypothetical protein HY718_21790 [Planctomycetes bacterium]|nr:hypothetical protein [Planctomycetota bacterium]